MHYYSVRHHTQFHYEQPISESVMELRLKPLSDSAQICHRFEVVLSPKAPLQELHDALGNSIHLFDIPGLHQKLAITSESLVEVIPPPQLPEQIPFTAWQAVDSTARSRYEYFEMLQSSAFTHPSEALRGLANELRLARDTDPLNFVRHLTTRLYDAFDYDPESTAVDSPIDVILSTRRGVCQDFTHVMIALLRLSGIPARYVSGYLFHREEWHDRSAEDASHAWVEAWIPDYGWLGFDPTNNLVCSERHIRVAVGRDYADVPPTKGVFRGEAASSLGVSVSVQRIFELPEQPAPLQSPVDWSLTMQQRQIQQQQQQQQQ